MADTRYQPLVMSIVEPIMKPACYICLICFILGCASHPDLTIKKDTTSQFNGLADHSLAASIDMLCGQDELKQKDIISDLPQTAITKDIATSKSVSPIATASLHTGISTSLGLASGAGAASSLGFGLAGGFVTLLSSGPHGPVVQCDAVTIIKLQDGEQPTDKAVFNKVLQETYSTPKLKRFELTKVDDNQAKFEVKPDDWFHGSAKIKFTYYVSPLFVQRAFPQIYSGDGVYVAYGVRVWSSSIDYTHSVINAGDAHTNNSVYFVSEGWNRYLSDNKTIELTSRVISTDKQKTVIRQQTYESLATQYDPNLNYRIALLNPKIDKETFAFR